MSNRLFRPSGDNGRPRGLVCDPKSDLHAIDSTQPGYDKGVMDTTKVSGVFVDPRNINF